MKTLFGLIAFTALFATIVYAQPPQVLGNVVDIDGKVTIHNEGSPRGKRIKKTPQDIELNQFVRTYANSKARVTLTDNSKILVTESSTLEFQDDQNIVVNEGKILFSINKREATRSLNVITKTAVIGVKGTRFLVETRGDEAFLHLEEGEVEVKSLAEEFDDYKSEYEAFKKQYMKEFSDFKKSITITSGTSLSLGNKGLLEVPTPDKIQLLFDELDAEFESDPVQNDIESSLENDAKTIPEDGLLH
ncbi:FecR family protein [Psychrosphaera algicola]|uniref:FecR family protein n=1 Tax=Psychrosphaera algicola TaxID=3023714 RepID=A0ABT5FC34_9GAMM|nr:FecR family protein [Psychrosphaera sp. G1-22]MDC2889109.1 FecR family protein [Psychrosphaera sp. G1-22]